MSFLREDDPPWLAAVLLGLALSALIALAVLHAENGHVTLTGRVSATEDEAEDGHFVIIGDSNTVVIDVSAWDYMIDYLRASNGRVVTLTIEPKPE